MTNQDPWGISQLDIFTNQRIEKLRRVNHMLGLEVEETKSKQPIKEHKQIKIKVY